MKYFVDSSAWIEYFNGSSAGEKVNNIISNEENDIFILTINIGEVISFLKRGDSNIETAYESMIKRAKIFEITPRIAKEAGISHAEKRMNKSTISLADTLIISSAKSINAKIIAKDPHFKDVKEAIIL
ncbi:MAG: PIN domain-containing protein [Nanoarchaeota archaeon]